MPPAQIPVVALVIFYAGGAVRESTLETFFVSPTGQRYAAGPTEMSFDRPDRLIRLQIGAEFEAVETGRHHFEVYLDGSFVTRVPFSIAYRRDAPTGAPDRP